MNEEKILNEFDFPYRNMSEEEKDKCLKIIKLNKELKNSNILKCNLKKENNIYYLNGIASSKFHNICFNSQIFISNYIQIISNITLLSEKNNEIKTNIFKMNDIFETNDNSIIHTFNYNNDEKYIETYEKTDDFNELLKEKSKTK